MVPRAARDVLALSLALAFVGAAAARETPDFVAETAGASAAVQAYAKAAQERLEKRRAKAEKVRGVSNVLKSEDMQKVLPKFHEESYWKDFYSKPEGANVEWFQIAFDVISSAFAARAPPSSRVLHLGCGTSAWPEAMWKAGWHDVVHCDLEADAIAMMRTKYGETLPGLAAQFEICDATALTYGKASFDVVLEKGTFDAMLGAGWRDAASPARRALPEILRVLRPGGVLMSLQSADLQQRGEFLESAGWMASTVGSFQEENGGRERFLHVVEERIETAKGHEEL